MVIQQRNAALCKFNKEPSTSNLNTFKLLRAKAMKTIKQTKKISWQNYVNKLNSSTKINTVWKMIRKILGKIQATPLKNLIKNKSEVTNIKDIADALTETFSANSSSNNKHKTENPKLSFKSNNAENYNGCFTLAKLKEVIQKSHNTTINPDEIHYEFLKQLPRRSLDCGGCMLFGYFSRCASVLYGYCSLNYLHHKYNTKLYNRVKEME